MWCVGWLSCDLGVGGFLIPCFFIQNDLASDGYCITCVFLFTFLCCVSGVWVREGFHLGAGMVDSEKRFERVKGFLSGYPISSVYSFLH